MTTSSHLTAVPDVPPLELGSHTVNLECPDCHAVVPTVATLSAVRTATTEDAGRLKLRMTNNKALEHHCGETGDGAGTPPMFGEAAADPFGGDPFGADK